MRPIDNIHKSIKKLHLKASAELDKRVHDDISRSLAESEKTESAHTEPNIWRTIIKSRITKLAAAAVIIIAVLAGINYFGGSIDGASVAWAEMIESMKQLPWMHIVMESNRGEGKQRFEVWVSFESQIAATKRSSGEAAYRNGRTHLAHVYDPDEHSITVSYFSDADDISKGATSVWNFWESWLKQVAESSTAFTEETGQYNRRKAKIYKVNASKDERAYEGMIIVDIERNLPVFGNQKSFDSNGNLIKEKDLYFEYPENGPASIYDVGVPKSAKVINNLPE